MNRRARQRSREPDFVSRDTGRLSAFSDAVFAIALTLPVLEIRLPGEGGAFMTGLQNMLPGLLVYLVTFSVGGIHWLAHYRLFGHVRRIDRRAMNSNLVFLLLFSLLPLTTSLLMNNAEQPIAKAMYSVNLGLLGLVLGFFSGYLDRRGFIERPALERYYRARSLAMGTLFLLQALLALVRSEWWAWSYLLFPVVFVVLRRLPAMRVPDEREVDELYDGPEDTPHPEVT